MRDEDRDVPDIIGRLHGEVHEQLGERAVSRFARPIGWLIALTLVVLIVIMATRANPL